MSVVDDVVEKRREWYRAWREANRERVRAADKKWRENNRERKNEINKRYLKTAAGKAAQKRAKKNQMIKVAQSVAANRLVHCYDCGSVYALEDAVHRGWKLIGRHGCVCDLCQPEGER